MALVRYEEMRAAVARCHRADEAKQIRDKALALEVYARQAQDRELLEWILEIQLRAERRAGQLIQELPKPPGPGRGKKVLPAGNTFLSLKRLKITPRQSFEWQKLARLPEVEFERRVAGVRAAVARDRNRVTRSAKPANESPSGQVPAAMVYSVAAWERLAPDARQAVIREANGKTQFNKQETDSIEWARWSWNPVTGCLHDCSYCYARDIANRFYPQGFVPTFVPERLTAPANTAPDPELGLGGQNVFVVSMGDLFGKWVPEDWITAIFDQVRAHPEWNFLFLTKFPQRLAEREWPDNAWCGTTVDTQARVKVAEKAFRDVKAGVRWLSVEPMMERLTFTALDMFNWIVLGGATASTQTPAFDPPLEWVLHLLQQVEAAKIPHVYAKANLRALRGHPFLSTPLR
jgi:protein gp37